MGSPRRPDRYRRRLNITVSINWQRCGPRARATGRGVPARRPRAPVVSIALAAPVCAVVANAIWPLLSGPVALSLMAPPCAAACIELWRLLRSDGAISRR